MNHAAGQKSRTRRRTRFHLIVALCLAIVLVGCGGDDNEESADGQDDTEQGEQSTGSGSSADDGVSTDDTGESVDGADQDETATPETLGFEGPVTVVVPNSPGTLSATGVQRVMTALVGEGPNAFLGGPDQPVTVRFDLVQGEQSGQAEGSWLTTNAAALGLYVSFFDFPSAGIWEVTVVADDEDLGSALVEVVAQSTVPNIGDPAPPSETRTATTPDEIAAISTDPDPDPDLYDLSIAEAVGNGRPTVVAFATPAFCQTALCGPTMEFVKAATAGRDDVDVVHVEPFDLELATQGTFEPLPPMDDWGLVTEPWVFIVDADGLVAATFEGIIGQAELEAALDAL